MNLKNRIHFVQIRDERRADVNTVMNFRFPNRLEEFYIHGSVHRESILITVQQDAIYSVYYFSVDSSTCFGC